jgi:hypothetical protein
MKRIIKTQKAYDELETSFAFTTAIEVQADIVVKWVPQNSTVHVVGSHKVEVHGPAKVSAHDNSFVTARGGAYVSAHNQSTIEAHDSDVWAFDAPHIRLWRSRCTSNSAATIYAYEGSHVWGYHGTLVFAEKGCQVILQGNSLMKWLE